MLSRLPDFVRIVRGFFVTEKKAALLRDDVVKKLVDSHPSRLPAGQLGVGNVYIIHARVDKREKRVSNSSIPACKSSFCSTKYTC